MNLIISSLSVSDTIQFSPCQNVLVKSRNAVSGSKDLSPCLLWATRHLAAIFRHAGLGTTHLPDWTAAWAVSPLPSHLLCKPLAWGLPWRSPVLICTASWSWVLGAFACFFLLQRTLWSCRWDLERLSSLQYSSLWLLNYRIRKAFNSFLPFSAVEWVPLSYLYISEIVWLLS